MIDSVWLRVRAIDPLHERFRPKKTEYQEIEEEIDATPNWPPINHSTTSLVDLMRMESVQSDLNFGDENPLITDTGDMGRGPVYANQGVITDCGPGGDNNITAIPQNAANSEVFFNLGGGNSPPSATTSPLQSPQSPSVPLLQTSGFDASNQKVTPVFDPSVPLINDIQDALTSPKRTSLDSAPLVDHEVFSKANATTPYLETTMF